MSEKIVLTHGSRSATVEINDHGRYTQLVVDGKVIVSARNDVQDKIDNAILALFMQGWKFTGGESLSYTTRFAIGEVIADGYQPIEVGTLVMSLRNVDLHEKSRMILYSSQTLAGLKKEGATNQRWSLRAKQLIRMESVERFQALMQQYFGKKEVAHV